MKDPASADELLILRAGLAACDDEALAAYSSWLGRGGLESLDGAAFRLLPLVYRRLERTGRTFERRETLKGVYLKSLFRNGLLVRAFLDAVGLLRREGVEAIPIKGAALVAAYYEDIALRPMSDIDLLVRGEDAERALSILSARGWRLKWERRRALDSRFLHSLPLVDGRGLELDLNLRAYYQCPKAEADEGLRDRTETVGFRGSELRLLCPADQLLHNCAHGSRWDVLSPVRWVADSLTILERRGRDVDWGLLVSEAAGRGLASTMARMLAFLVGNFGARVPGEAMATLDALAGERASRSRDRLFPAHLRAAFDLEGSGSFVAGLVRKRWRRRMMGREGRARILV